MINKMYLSIIKTYSLRIGGIAMVALVFYFVYYLLLRDNALHTSITSIIGLSNHSKLKGHLLVLGFLPIYIAAMVFGSGLLGAYLGSHLERLLVRVVWHK